MVPELGKLFDNLVGAELEAILHEIRLALVETNRDAALAGVLL